MRTVHTSQNCSDSIPAGDLDLGSALVFFEHGFAGLNLFMLLTFAYVMVNYYDSSSPGFGFSIIKGRQQERQGRCALNQSHCSLGAFSVAQRRGP